MSKKKTKRMTIKEIVDAYYSGVSPEKITKMAQKLIEQEDSKLYVKCHKDK
jgi:hypothetical protein